MVKKISSIMILILTIILISLTVYKLNKKHENKLYNVLYSKIEYQANRCFLEGKCTDNITLEELYEKEYLTTMYDPITKQELNKNTKIKITNETIEIEK